jgi:chromosomal replication initiation ATPase DnaA
MNSSAAGSVSLYALPGLIEKGVCTLRNLEALLSEALQLPVADMRQKSRRADRCAARQLFFYFATKLKKHLPLSEQSDVAIGRYYGMNHSTVIYSARRIQELAEVYDAERLRCARIEEAIRSRFEC